MFFKIMTYKKKTPQFLYKRAVQKLLRQSVYFPIYILELIFVDTVHGDEKTINNQCKLYLFIRKGSSILVRYGYYEELYY